LAAFVARCKAPSPRLREILGASRRRHRRAWIASLPTPEGARSCAGAPQQSKARRQARSTGCARRCDPLRLARLSESGRYPSRFDDDAGSDRVPGAIAIAAALRDRDPDALAAAIIAGYE